MAFFCLIITGISITGNVIQANQVKTIPYIIEVDKLGKEVMRLEKLEALDVETLTPIEALNFLYELKKTLKGSLNG